LQLEACGPSLHTSRCQLALIKGPYQLSRNPASQLQLLHFAGPVITTDPRTCRA